MKTLRIKLRQSQASYTREETVNNRMTYPLPPFSTIIGALHNACGYKTYHPMEISVQGRYGAMHTCRGESEKMQSRMYIHHTFLNSVADDRGILVWFPNTNTLSGSYVVVAESTDPKNCSFEKRIGMRERDTELLEQYIALRPLKKILRANIKTKRDEWLSDRRALLAQRRTLDKNSSEFKEVQDLIKVGDKVIQFMEDDYVKTYEEPYSHFRTLVKEIWHQEVLYDIELVIHVRADDKVIDDILENKYNLVSLGRSEDFIDLVEMKEVSVQSNVLRTVFLPDGYTMYVNTERIDNGGTYRFFVDGEEVEPEGTVFYVNKNYQIDKKGLRVHHRIPCLYTSNVAILETSQDITWDGEYIIDFN